MNPITILQSKKPTILIQILVEKYFNLKLRSFDKIENLFFGKTGIEIGGPSQMFKTNEPIPLYDLAKQVDGCNFSSHTAWEGEIKEGETYQYQDGKRGHQYICDGVDVPIIPKQAYDFVLSCHNLEHIANPMKALDNWIKLLKPSGSAILLVLPRKESNFDHKRPTTTFEHLLEDYKNNTGEDDLTHLPEILKLHDLRFDPLAGGLENFTKRSQDNFNNRCLHHHVYSLDLLEKMCHHFNLKVVLKESRVGDHIVVAVN